jgi:hypothetical protein
MENGEWRMENGEWRMENEECFIWANVFTTANMKYEL